MIQTDPHCDNCTKFGLPILPVRYAVVPTGATARLPGVIAAPKLKGITLKEHAFALRALRMGFLYIFYEKKWNEDTGDWYGRVQRSYETYSVDPTGSLWKQHGPISAKPADKPNCGTTGHNIPTSIIAIKDPEKAGMAWIAFSEYKWSLETLLHYGKDEDSRSVRMQKIDPAKLALKPDHPDGFAATENNIKSILEYQPKGNEIIIIDPKKPQPVFAKEDGTYDDKLLHSVASIHPVHLKTADAPKMLVEQMAVIGGGKEQCLKKPYAPIVLALWDAVGMGYELGGSRNEPIGRVAEYQEVCKFPLVSLGLYDGLQKVMGQKAQLDFNDAVKNQNKLQNTLSQSFPPSYLRTAAQTPWRQQAGQTPYINQDADLLEYLQKNNVAPYIVNQICPTNPDPYNTQLFAIYNDPGWRSGDSNTIAQLIQKRTAKYNDIKAQGDQYLQGLPGRQNEEVAYQWGRLTKKLDSKRLENFKKQHQNLLDTAQKLADARTPDLIALIESQHFLDCLEDCHAENLEDGIIFAEQVSDIIYGMQGSPVGAKKLDAWAQDVNASTKQSNLIWRAVALNQKAVRAEIDTVLQDAKAKHTSLTLASALDITGYTAKYLKGFADTYKKAQGIYGANEKAMAKGSEPKGFKALGKEKGVLPIVGDRAFGVQIRPVKTFGIDKFLATVGENIFSAYRIDKLGDYASEMIMQHMFSVRAFVEPEYSAKLIYAQAKTDKISRQATLDRMRLAKKFMAIKTPEMLLTQREDLKQEWADFKKSSKGPNAIRDARLSAIVGIIELVNMFKLGVECYTKNDIKTWSSLLASTLSVASALLDIASVLEKNIKSMGVESMAYQRLKLVGGTLSSTASGIGIILDVFSAKHAAELGQNQLKWAYYIKAGFGTAGLGSTLGSALTYGGPLLEDVIGVNAAGVMVRAGSLLEAAIGARILIMSLGAWVTVASIIIQIAVWYYTDDDLQIWFDHSYFGNNHQSDNGGYTNIEEQNKALDHALIKIGLKEDDSPPPPPPPAPTMTPSPLWTAMTLMP